MANSDFKFGSEPVDFSKATTMEFIPSRAGKASGINFAWLKEFARVFEQQIEGQDGEAVGRQLWTSRDDAWRAARSVGSELAYKDAVAEADAWNNR